ncbi:MAG: hypothetical protein IJ408_05530 [Clostridia bacterium]|nr:hypothetical protein [Clostridia bacterium]
MSGSKKNILFYILLTLIALTLISTFLLSGIYAKYVTTHSASDSARVAKFDVGEDGGMFTASYAVELDPETDETIADALTLFNSSEVAVECVLSMESYANLPLTYTWTENGTEHTANADDTLTLNFPPLAGQTDFDLTVGWDTASEENLSFIYRRQVDKIILNIECNQID